MPAIDNINNTITSIPMTDYASSASPTTPDTGKSRIFTRADGAYWIDDEGNVTGPFGESSFTNPMTTAGDIIIGGASGTPARLAVGTAGKHLAVNSGATAPEWVTTDIGARAYNSSDITISNNSVTALTFNSERYDTDTIHDTSSNTGRLTCKTAGKYLIIGNIQWVANATGYREFDIRLNGTTFIANTNDVPSSGGNNGMIVSTIYSLAVNDYVELIAFQTSGGNLNIVAGANFSPEFMMQRIG